MAWADKECPYTGGHACRHIPDFHFHLQIVTGRIQPRMRHIGPALGRTRRASQAHDLRAQKNTPDACRHRVPAQQPGGGIAHPLDNVRQAENRFLARKAVRQVFQDFCQRPNLLLGNLFRLVQYRGDQRLALDIPLRFAAPAPVANFRIIVGRLSGPRDLVRRRRPRRVALDRKAHLPGRFDNRGTALGPVSDQVLGHACDPRELSILAILFHADAEAFLQAPSERIAVDRSRRLHPGVDRVLMQRPVLAVPVCPGGIEDHAVGMQLGVVVAAGAMLEHRRRYIGGQHLDIAVPVTDTGIGAMAHHGFLQRYASRIVMRVLDL